jgi:4-hydroxy-tetrahydrodipicolinate synthase
MESFMSEMAKDPSRSLGGIIAASLTPVDAAFGIDVDRLARHVNWLMAQGCSFVSPFGSTGEGPSFSVAEKTRALRALVAEGGIAADRLIPAAMSTSVDDTVASIRCAAELGCRAVLIVPPYYYGATSQDGVSSFLETSAARLGGAFPLDVVLYHIPAMSRVGYGVDLVGKLVDRFGARIVGIKDSTGDKAHSVMLAKKFPDLRIFTGDDRVLPALLAAGGAGMIGGLPNVVARTLRQLYDATPQEREQMLPAAAARIEAVDANGGIIALKALVSLIHRDPEWARPMTPLLPLDAARTEALVEVFGGTAAFA